MKAGQLSLYVVFEKPTDQPDDGGGTASIFVESFRAWVMLQPMGAFERVRNSRQEMEVTHWMHARNCGVTITNDMRIRELTVNTVPAPPVTAQDRIFGIEGVYDPTERGWEYKLMVAEAPGRN